MFFAISDVPLSPIRVTLCRADFIIRARISNSKNYRNVGAFGDGPLAASYWGNHRQRSTPVVAVSGDMRLSPTGWMLKSFSSETKALSHYYNEVRSMRSLEKSLHLSDNDGSDNLDACKFGVNLGRRATFGLSNGNLHFPFDRRPRRKYICAHEYGHLFSWLYDIGEDQRNLIGEGGDWNFDCDPCCAFFCFAHAATRLGRYRE